MASNYFLKIDNVDSECMQEGVEGWLELESWSWGASNQGTASKGSGLGSGVGSCQDFHFVIHNGKASPLLLKHCANGKHFKKAELLCRKTVGEGNPETFLKVVFSDLVVSSYQLGGSAQSGDSSPMEQIGFNFSKMEFDQKKQGQDGKLVAGDQVAWDLKLQKVA